MLSDVAILAPRKFPECCVIGGLTVYIYGGLNYIGPLKGVETHRDNSYELRVKTNSKCYKTITYNGLIIRLNKNIENWASLYTCTF